MNGLLLRKELLALMRDGRAMVLGLAVVALFAAVYGASHLEVQQARQDKQQAEAAARTQWDTQGDKHPHRGAHFGLYVFAPESALAAFDPGIGRHLGQALWLEPHKRNMQRFSAALDDPVSGRFGEFTPAFVLTVVLPLLLIALVFNAITQERESGTLRMLRGLTLREQRFVWSKFVAMMAAASLLILAVFAVVLWPAARQDGSGALLRGSLLGAAFVVYCAIYIAFGLTVSALARSSRQALALLVAAWIVFVFVVPRVGAAAAAAAVPLPSAEQFWSAIRHDIQHGLPGDDDLATRGRRYDEHLLRQYGVARLEDLPVGAYALRRLQRDAYADKVHALHFDALWQRYAEQEAVLRMAAAFSPVVAMRLLSMKLAGTDLAHRRHFEDAAERYRRYVNTRIDEWDAANSRGLRSFEDKYGNDGVWQSIERFSYRAPASGFALRAALPEILILLAWVLAAAGLLALAGRRLRT